MNRWAIALSLTYGNVLAGFGAIILVVTGYPHEALIALIIGALCDASDGVVARHSPQTPLQKKAGTVADSLADIVTFGVFPAVFLATVTNLSPFALVVAILYVLAALHRLVMFTAKALIDETPTKVFSGAPVVTVAVALPLTTMIAEDTSWYSFGLTALLAVLALLYVSKLPVPKPHGIAAYISYGVLAALFITGLLL